MRATFFIPFTSIEAETYIEKGIINQTSTHMKKSAFATSAFLLAVITLSACAQSSYKKHVSSGLFSGKTVEASDNYVTKEMRVKDFDEIRVTGSLDVSYTQRSGKPEVEIYTSDNVIDLLDIYVKDGCLNVGFKKNVNVKYNKLEVRVSSDELSKVNVVGSGDFDFVNGLKTDKLSIKVTGSGDVRGENIRCSESLSMSVAGSGDIKGRDFSTETLEVSVAGSGDLNLQDVKSATTDASVAGSGTVRIKGYTQDATYSVAGSGDLYADEFEAQNVAASVAGSGDIRCHAVKHLKARTSGSGDIGYKGNPEVDYQPKGLYKL